MAQAQSGDKVRIHYTGTLDDGTVFDSSAGREPLEFTIGTRQVIPGFEEAVLGLEVGGKVRTHIPSHKAYGPRDERMIMQIPREQIPADMQIAVDDRLQMQRRDGGASPVTVREITDTHVVLDGNHPLAGQDLTFEIELVEIV